MNNPLSALPATRREFLSLSAKGIGLLAFSRYAPAFLTASTLEGAPPPERDRTILVLIQLAGGNDGLNTVVPFEDDRYYALRPTLGLRRDVLHAIEGRPLGLHPSLGGLHRLLADGKLAIVQNVGYPNPNRSHFRSSEIWETASSADDTLATGWIGRFLDNNCGGAPRRGTAATETSGRQAHGLAAHSREDLRTPTAFSGLEPQKDAPACVHVSSEVPQSFLASRPHNVFGLSRAMLRPRGAESARLVERMIDPAGAPVGSNLSFLQHTMMDALATERRIQRVLGGLRPDGNWPQSQLALSLRSVGALIGANLPTRVYFVSLGGFDTHGNQLNTHAQLLRQLGDAMVAFQKDLEARGLADQVLTMTFSEFGRRPSENESKGTDHGTAAPLFVMGSRVKGGLHGQPPALDVGPNRDLTFSTDFRGVYATVLDRWLQCDSPAVLGGRFEHLGFV